MAEAWAGTAVGCAEGNGTVAQHWMEEGTARQRGRCSEIRAVAWWEVGTGGPRHGTGREQRWLARRRTTVEANRHGWHQRRPVQGRGTTVAMLVGGTDRMRGTAAGRGTSGGDEGRRTVSGRRSAAGEAPGGGDRGGRRAWTAGDGGRRAHGWRIWRIREPKSMKGSMGPAVEVTGDGGGGGRVVGVDDGDEQVEEGPDLSTARDLEAGDGGGRANGRGAEGGGKGGDGASPLRTRPEHLWAAGSGRPEVEGGRCLLWGRRRSVFRGVWEKEILRSGFLTERGRMEDGPLAWWA